MFYNVIKLSIPKHKENGKYQVSHLQKSDRTVESDYLIFVKPNSGTPRLHTATGVMGCHAAPHLRSGLSSEIDNLNWGASFDHRLLLGGGGRSRPVPS